MGWSNWIDIGIGLGLGLSLKSLITQWQQQIANTKPETFCSQQLKKYLSAYYMAVEMSQFKAGFLARVAHELRSPINSLIGLHQLILDNLCENSEEEREFIAQAHQSALKLVQLLDQILAVARIEHGSTQLQIQQLELGLLIQEVHQLTYLLAVDRRLSFQILALEPGIFVLADPRWLRQVLVSLIETAIMLTEQGSIYLSTKAVPTDRCVYIWLDVSTKINLWSTEAVDLLSSSEFLEHDISSPGLKLMLNQSLLELMAGRLEILSVVEETPQTRLQISLPLV